MTASPSDFGSRLRRLRHGAGLSQEELAEQAGVSARAVSDMERGLRQHPRPETLRMLADAMALQTKSGVPEGATFLSMDIAALATALALYPQAARLSGWSDRQRIEIGADPPPVPEKWHFDEAFEQTRAHLGNDAFARLLADGAGNIPPEQRAQDIETVFSSARAHIA